MGSRAVKLGRRHARDRRLWGEWRGPRGQVPSAAGDGATLGFTLLEIMVAIVLTSVVALVAYDVAQVSADVHSRVGAALRTQQGTRATRELLQDVLRNARTPRGPADTMFALRGGRLSFVAAGAGPPFDADYDWRIVIEPDARGLALTATPVGRAPPAAMAFHLAGVSQWDVRVRGRDEAAWTQEWTATANLPRAIAVTLRDRAGPVGPPLLIASEVSSAP